MNFTSIDCGLAKSSSKARDAHKLNSFRRQTKIEYFLSAPSLPVQPRHKSLRGMYSPRCLSEVSLREAGGGNQHLLIVRRNRTCAFELFLGPLRCDEAIERC